MGRAVWSGYVARALLPLVEFHYAFGRDLDREWNDPEGSRSVSVAQVLSGVLDTPADDGRLIEVCRRDGLEAPVGTLWALAVLVLPGGRTLARAGVWTRHGVIESAGEHLGRIDSPETSRYAAWFYLPGVAYPGGGGA